MSTHWQPGSIDLPASGVTAGTYGDGTHVGRVTVAESGLVTAASNVAITGGGGGGAGSEIGYDQITTGVLVTSTTEAAPTTIITCAAHVFDGAPVVCEFYSSQIQIPNGSVFDVLGISLWEGATELGILAFLRSAVTANTVYQGGTYQVRFTPSAASHTYLIRAWASSTSGNPSIGAGAGGVGNNYPAFARFTKV